LTFLRSHRVIEDKHGFHHNFLCTNCCGHVKRLFFSAGLSCMCTALDCEWSSEEHIALKPPFRLAPHVKEESGSSTVVGPPVTRRWFQLLSPVRRTRGSTPFKYLSTSYLLQHTSFGQERAWLSERVLGAQPDSGRLRCQHLDIYDLTIYRLYRAPWKILLNGAVSW